MYRSQAEFCRHQAERLTALANQCVTPNIRKDLVEIAKQWAALAKTEGQPSRSVKPIFAAASGVGRILLIKCPQTGQHLATGIQIAPEHLDMLDGIGAPVHCPHCDKDHRWTKRDAVLVPPNRWSTVPEVEDAYSTEAAHFSDRRLCSCLAE